MPHRARGAHRRYHPVQMMMRLRGGLRPVRTPRAFGAISAAIAGSSSEAFRILQFTVQDNHLHLMVEAEGREALMAGAKGFAVRRRHQPWSAGFDAYSSAPWFDGWKRQPHGAEPPPTGIAPPVVAPRTWLAATGWRKRNLIDPAEQPGLGPRLPGDWVLTEL
jgi:hypothetical protein